MVVLALERLKPGSVMKHQTVGMGRHELVPAPVVRGIDVDDPEIDSGRGALIRNHASTPRKKSETGLKSLFERRGDEVVLRSSCRTAMACSTSGVPTSAKTA